MLVTMAAAAVIRTQANRTNTTVGTSMEAAPDSPSSIAHEVFGAGAAGKFGLGDSFQFKGKVPGSEASDAINLVDLDHTPASISHHGSGKGTSGPLAIFEEAIDLSSSSHHWSDHHGNSPDHERHGVSHVQHDLMV